MIKVNDRIGLNIKTFDEINKLLYKCNNNRIHD